MQPKWREIAAQHLREAADALEKSHDTLFRTSFRTAAGYIQVQARDGDRKAARNLLAGLQQSLELGEQTEQITFSVEELEKMRASRRK